MHTYIFENTTKTVKITVMAPSEDEAWRVLELKMDVLRSMGVELTDEIVNVLISCWGS